MNGSNSESKRGFMNHFGGCRVGKNRFGDFIIGKAAGDNERQCTD